ncbi:MAG: hypothetical protein LZ173_09710 [Thaumarchaeota archaeon]|jgi:hypothetical protein|nr:hypothetical protein [Candidatus Geocrenenecus arthurdayi]
MSSEAIDAYKQLRDVIDMMVKFKREVERMLISGAIWQSQLKAANIRFFEQQIDNLLSFLLAMHGQILDRIVSLDREAIKFATNLALSGVLKEGDEIEQ